MLSFSTEFPVEETSASNFCRSVANWLEGSPHTEISADQVWELATSQERSWKSGSEALQCVFEESDSRRSAGFKYLKSEKDVDWITTVCFDSDHVDSWVSVRTERQSSEAQPYLPQAKKPFVIRNLMQELGGGVDGEVRVADAAHYLDGSDVSMVVRLLNGDSEHHLPIVYVSCPFSGDRLFDIDALARHLGGLAHVLVEPSRDFSREIQGDVFSSNPYGGYVGIYFSEAEHRKLSIEFFDGEFEFRRAIFRDIRNSLLNRRPLPRCSWSNIEALSARKEREALRKHGSEDVDMYAATFDKEMKAKDEQLSLAEVEIERLKSISHDSSKRKIGKTGLNISFGKEQELSDDEFLEVLMEVLRLALQNEHENSRRHHILQAAVDSNPTGAKLNEKREHIKSLLRDYRSMNGKLRSELLKMGFYISEDGKHYKLVYKGDSRYTHILPKSGSDHRGGLNSATDISRSIF